MKVKLRTPHELFYDEFDINQNEFIVESVFKDQVFGKYQGLAVSMDIESYNKIKNENKDSTER